MSFDLFVDTDTPELSAWTAAFEEVGVEVDFHPAFEPRVHDGGFVPVTLRVVSEERLGLPAAALNLLREARAPGFEFSCSARGCRLSGNRDTWLHVWLAAAALSVASEGPLHDPWEGKKHRPDNAWFAARRGISAGLAE